MRTDAVQPIATRARGGRLAIATAIAALALAPTAVAAPTWLAPVDLSAAGQNADRPQVGTDQAGDVIAVWNRSNGANTIVQASTRPAGGGFSAPVDLSAAGQNAFDQQVAMNPAGDAIAVWSRLNGINSIVQAAMRPAGGGFSSPVDLSAAGQSADVPQVAMNPAGDAIVVWRRSNGTNFIVQAATRSAGGGFSPPVDLSAAGQSADLPQVTIDPAGNAVAVWARFDGTNEIVQAATRPAGGAFSAPIDLSVAGQTAGSPHVAIDQAGNAIAVWERFNGANGIVQASTRPAGGAFSASVDLSAAGQNANFPRVAVDQAGDAIAVWTRGFGANTIVQAVIRPAGLGFSAPVDLSAAGQSADVPRVAVDPAGDAVAVWNRFDGTNEIVQAATRPAGRAFAAPVDLSAAGQNALVPQVAIDQAGDAIAVWARSNGTSDIVQAAGFDAVGPQLRGLSVPANGVVGVPVSVAVSPFDVWSALGATSWSFGDGATATGTSARHTYSRPGTFSVGVTAADVVGNAGTVTRAVTIAPAPPVAVAAVSGLRLSSSAFRAARSGPTVKAAAARTGTRVSYQLNVAASVRFTVQRATSGRRVGGRCVKSTRANRKRKACTRFVAVRGSFTRTRAAGADAFRFTGRLAGHALKRGRYRLIATPAANNKTDKPTLASFRIVK